MDETEVKLSPDMAWGPTALVVRSTVEPWFQTWFMVHDWLGFMISVVKIVVSPPLITAEVFVKAKLMLPGTTGAPPFMAPVMAYVCTTAPWVD